MHDLFIEMNGKSISLSEHFPGVFIQEVIRKSPQIEIDSEKITGTDGVIPHTVSFQPFTIQVTAYLQALDISDYHLVARELYQFLFQRESYYIWSETMPGIRYHVFPKPFDFDRQSERVALFTLEFDCFKGYGESRGTTLDPLTFETELWQIGNGLVNPEDLRYTFSDALFRVYNASSDRIDPLMRHELTIAISGKGCPTLTNKTNGSSFALNRDLRHSDRLVIDGIYPYLNDDRCGKDSNHGVIQLEKGWNQFELTGLEEQRIAFAFPFIYR
ncbi:phage tail family protein [Listeria costaricensis]|uniref:phage tail family protein n=1 Tax=Listeria costaricensis TaxID=2026604 RepID=UPI000C072414|nr:phage tail family protein [Listeria costaricensis]